MTHDFRCHRMLGLDRLARALDTRMLSFAMTLVLVALLIVFYTVNDGEHERHLRPHR